MRAPIKPLLLSGAAAAALLASASAGAADLKLSRVVLSAGGVGYFEYEARVAGAAELGLDVRLDRVDDVLKSVMVYDDKGGVGSISLPGREPLREVLREMPFGLDALDSPAALLAALRGAEVEIAGPRALRGRVLAAVPAARKRDGVEETVTRLTLATPDGLRQAVLEDAEAVAFADPRLRDSVGRALEAMARLGERDRRRLTVRIGGEGERTVRVGYVVEAPVWKASYRLALGRDGAPARLQGWAVVENLRARLTTASVADSSK